MNYRYIKNICKRRDLPTTSEGFELLSKLRPFTIDLGKSSEFDWFLLELARKIKQVVLSKNRNFYSILSNTSICYNSCNSLLYIGVNDRVFDDEKSYINYFIGFDLDDVVKLIIHNKKGNLLPSDLIRKIFNCFITKMRKDLEKKGIKYGS